LPPARDEGAAASGGAPPPDEEATVVGIAPSDELLSSPRSAVKKSAEAGAEDIDALFDEIRIGD
jgi:hypothetical protein